MNAPVVPSRWFAFRLSTLVLAVWTIAAAGLIWWRWEPWTIDVAIDQSLVGLNADRSILITEKSAQLMITDVRTNSKVILPPLEDVCAVGCSMRRNKLVRITSNGTAVLYEIPSGREISRAKFPPTWVNESSLIWLMAADTIVLNRKYIYRLNQDEKKYSLERRIDSQTPNSLRGPIVRAEPRPGYPAPDDALLLWAEGDTVQLYDLEARSVRCVLENCVGQDELRFSNDGAFVCAPNAHWDTQTGRQLRGKLNQLPPEANPESISLRENYGLPLHDKCDAFFIYPAAARRRALEISFLGTHAIAIWTSRHPPSWWGHFYRPEVWAGIVLGCVWLLKLWRRVFRKAVPA